MVSYLFVLSATKAKSDCLKLPFYRRSRRQRGSTPSDRSAAKDISMHAKLALHSKKDNKWQFTSFLRIKDVLVLAQKAPTGRCDLSNIVPDISRSLELYPPGLTSGRKSDWSKTHNEQRASPRFHSPFQTLLFPTWMRSNTLSGLLCLKLLTSCKFLYSYCMCHYATLK